MTEYRPGLRGYVAHLGLPELWAEVRADGFERGSRTIPLVLGMLARRARPSDRLRQATAQLDTLRRRSRILGELSWTPEVQHSERLQLRRALLSLLPTLRADRAAISAAIDAPEPPAVAEGDDVPDRSPGNPELEPRACAVCGAGEDLVLITGRHWARPDLCSACRPIVDGLGRVDR